MATPTDAETLPLLEALLQWSDQALVEAVRVEERRLTSDQLAHLQGRPVLVRPLELRPRDPRGGPGGPPDLTPLLAAWRALERDFKRRLVRAEGSLLGVPVAPMRLADRVKIPGIWAADFEFELLDDALRITGARYVAVIVHREAATTAADPPRGTSPEGPVADEPADETPQPAEVAGAAAPVDQKARRPGGRKSMVPAIRAAVREFWADIQAQVARTGGEPVWTDLARLLERRMCGKSGRNAGSKLPQWDTIRTRLPKIYREAVSEKAIGAQSDRKVRSASQVVEMTEFPPRR